MAGIGIKLNKIYRKKSIVAHLYGFSYSTVITVAPMFVVIGAILLSQMLLSFRDVGYMQRELFSDTVLYIFIFSLLMASPFNAVLSKYISDMIFEEKYGAIMPCFYAGLGMNTALGSLFGIPFCVREYIVGKVPLYYVFTGYCGYMALLLVFYTMLYLSITKSYGKISLFFIIGMCFTVLLSVIFHWLLGMEATYSLLLALVIGFVIICELEIALLRSFFLRNNGAYRPVFRYMKKYWKMIVINFLYILGLYIHNFVFWTTDMKNVLVHTFVTAQPYDMATCLAMFTNISATIIFITNVELHFRDRYRRYFEAVIGGRGHDIVSAKKRMFRQLSTEIMSLIRIQFIISVVVFLICMVILPMIGFSGRIMRMYPCLSVGYFILFVMYSEVLFLYYFDDLTGALAAAASFCFLTFIGSIGASFLTEVWYGSGLILGALSGFSVAYFRLRWVENNLDEYTFCQGNLIPQAKGERPPSMVYQKSRQPKERNAGG